MKNPFTTAAVEAATKSAQTCALLRADMDELNSALTVGSTTRGGNAAERLAHDVLLCALERFALVHVALQNLASVMEENQ